MNIRLVGPGIWILLAACNGDLQEDAAAGTQLPNDTTLISEVQGSGSESPLLGQRVRIYGIVTGDFQTDVDRSGDLGGFFIQQETPDSDATTSEAVFVYEGDNPQTDVSVGDIVDVKGMVKEHFGETQIEAVSVTITGTGAIQPTDVNLPAEVTSNSDGETIADLERFEGMLVRFPQDLAVSSLRFLEQFGEVRLTQGGRPFQFTNGNPPDAEDYAAHSASLATRSLFLDDGLRSSNPAEIRYLHAGPTDGYSIRVGDSLTGVTGNLRYSRGSGGRGPEGWRLVPTREPLFTDNNPRPGAPSVAGSTRIASFNVLNLFSAIDDGSPACGPRGDQGCRGADSATELDRQLGKITTALLMLDADVVGLIELENNASESLALVVDALNMKAGPGAYAYVDTGAISTDAIKTGFIFKTAEVREKGSFAILDSTIDARFDDRRNRPALAQTFARIDGGGSLTIAVNHLKSKGSGCESDGDPNTGDGQGNCNLTRTRAAAALADWLSSDPTDSGDADILIIGDLNAYTQEDPLTALRRSGMTSLLDSIQDPYSFVFDAKAGALDHAVASPSLLGQVREATEWHINADEPQLLDYNLENGRDPGLFDPGSPYRSSDHDPVIVGLDLIN